MKWMLGKISALLLAAESGLDLVLNTKNAGNALLLMLLGMVGIFVVMLVIMLVVKVLNTVTKDDDEKK